MSKFLSKAKALSRKASRSLRNLFITAKEAVLSKIEKLRSRDYTTQKRHRHHAEVKKRQIAQNTPVMGAPGDMKVRSAAVEGRARFAARGRKRTVVTVLEDVWNTVKTFSFRNRRRFTTVVSVAVAAILVPVIVVSANTSADNSAQAGEDENGSEAAVVEYTDDFTDAVPLASGQSEDAIDEGAAVDEDGNPVVADKEEAEPEPEYLALEPESVHTDVMELQARLMELNYMDNDEPTDYYGPMTQQAVQYFQRKHGLTQDGYAGEETQELLFSEEATHYSVSLEAEGPDVSNIQDRLNELGYDVGYTGYFGEETEKAVKYFQRMNGLDDDGTVGKYTKDLLFSEDAEYSEEYYAQKEREQSSGSGGSSSGGGSSKGSGGSSGGGGGSTSHTANPGSVSAFISAAQSQLGKPYVTGGKGPDSFDCSGLVYYALKASGNSIGYMTSGGWASSGYATVTSIDALQPGDIICFSGHVGVYIGGGTMVDASSSNGQVVQRSCTGSWSRNNFICGKRPL